MKKISKIIKVFFIFLGTVVLAFSFYIAGHGCEKAISNAISGKSDIVEYNYDNNGHFALKQRIVEYGDTLAFREFIENDSINPLERLAYAMYMSNRFNNAYASYKVYEDLSKWNYLSERDTLDTRTKILSFFYLKKSAELDDQYLQILKKKQNEKM